MRAILLLSPLSKRRNIYYIDIGNFSNLFILSCRWLKIWYSFTIPFKKKHFNGMLQDAKARDAVRTFIGSSV